VEGGVRPERRWRNLVRAMAELQRLRGELRTALTAHCLGRFHQFFCE
jgi:hypothetical protein